MTRTSFFRRGQNAAKWLLPGVSIAYFLIACAQDNAQQGAIRQPATFSSDRNRGEKTQITLPPVFLDPDSLCWTVYAHRLVERGEFRARVSPIGNAPVGRPMLWSQLYLWWVVALGGIAALFQQSSWSQGINTAVFWSNPLAFIIFASAWFALVRKYAGPLAAAIGLLLLNASPAINADFGWWHPDHHGFHLAAMLGALTAAALGMKSLLDGEAKVGARLLLLAGVIGGVGLWIGATQQATVVAVIGTAGLVGSLSLPRERLAAWDKTWMVWATAGATTSLVGFVIEFFPELADTRLEVNHPAFAAAWFGGGLLIRGICRMRNGPSGAGHAWLGGILLLLLPVMILTAPLSQYSLRDPVVRRCHQLIIEFQPAWQGYGMRDIARGFACAAILVPAGIGLVWIRRRKPALVATLGLALAATLAFGVTTVLQIRWASFCGASLVLLAALLAHYAETLRPPRRLLWSALTLCVGIALYQMTVDSTIRLREFHGLRSELVKSIGSRDIAIALRAANGGAPIVVVGEPTIAPALYAYGRIGSVAALYWEATSGIHAAADILSSRDSASAERIVRDLHVTHFVIDASPATVLDAAWTAFASRDPAVYQSTLAWNLAKPEPAPPSWLQLESEHLFLGRDRPTRFYRVLPPAPKEL